MALFGAAMRCITRRTPIQSSVQQLHSRLMATGRLGVIGGSGPEAGIYVATMLLDEHRARLGDRYQSDRDAPDVLLVQNPGMGGPHGAHDILLPGQESVFEQAKADALWAGLMRSINDVERTDCSHFCVCCNQLHILEPKIRTYLKDKRYSTEFISIIKCTSQAIAKLPAASRSERPPRTFILGTKPVMDIAGPSAVSPYSSVDNLVSVPESLRTRLAELIILVKRDGPTETHKLEMRAIMDNLITDVVLPDSKEGPIVFCLCCTELPLLLDSFPAEVARLAEKHATGLGQLSFHLLDPSRELAKACLDTTHAIP